MNTTVPIKQFLFGSRCKESSCSQNWTEDSLLSSYKTNHITDSHSEVTFLFSSQKGLLNRSMHLIVAISMIIIATLSLIWTPFNLLLRERLKMTPGLPPFEWWKNPPDEVLLRVYVFNITNSEEFMAGNHTQLHFQEIGPIIFREKLTHTNVRFNSNGTMTYYAKRTPLFLNDMNSIDMNATLITLNLSLLGMASYFWDASIFTKISFNLMTQHSTPIVTTTIHDYLWNFSDPLLDLAQTLSPQMVPVKNMGILSRIYDDFEDTVTVYIGPTYSHDQFFLIDKFDFSEYLPGHNGMCKDKIVNSTEGVVYPQFLTKNSDIRYWRKTVCRATRLKFMREETRSGIKAYRFILPRDVFHRTEPSKDDCYKGRPSLQNGLSDVSQCYYDFPMAASFPHFLHADENVTQYMSGMNPNNQEHGSFVLIEPITGIPMESKARSQSNLVMRDLSGFSENVQKFSDKILPMFWAEYNQVGLPWYILAIVYFTVNVVPFIQIIFTSLLYVIAIYLIVRFNTLLKQQKTGKKEKGICDGFQNNVK